MSARPPPRLVLPDGPVIAARHGRAILLEPSGALVDADPAAVRARLKRTGVPIVCHAPATARRLGLDVFPAADVLELFSFVRPGDVIAPSPAGLADALGLARPVGLSAEAALIREAAIMLLRALAAARAAPANATAAGLAALMGQAGWPWTASILAALAAPDATPDARALRVWERLAEWEEIPLPLPPAQHAIEPADARRRLAEMLGPEAENRPGQADFASAACAAFTPRIAERAPRMVLAEAGTGTGKTAGYLAPASLWAERNGAPVWISTYTRNLQRQVEAETARLYPDEGERRARVVVRKGRENYLCLLNYEEAIAGPGRGGSATVALGLVSRWAERTRDGDLVGGDFPGWLPELLGQANTLGLADRRGECIHAACPHYRVCFIERTARRARAASLVIANHALVMVQAAWGGLDDPALPYRYVFDEGHHLFDAADSVFSAVLSGAEAAELRRWIRGAEGGRSRARGLHRRLEDLVADRPALAAALDAAVVAAKALPEQGWLARLAEAKRPELGGLDPGAANPCEAFLRLVRAQVLARSRDGEGATRETEVMPTIPGLAEAAQRFERALAGLERPLAQLRQGLLDRLAAEADTLESETRRRIESAAKSLAKRALEPLAEWRAMLRAVAEGTAESGGPGERFVDWFEIAYRQGHEADVGMRRHWVDPTVPFIRVVAEPAHGLLVTSATLRDPGAGSEEASWAAAEETTGAIHLLAPPVRAAVASPFDYAAATRAFVVTDVARDDPAQVAAAYRVLFEAAGGGALGLFTAIARLREVHRRIAGPLAEAGITLYAQHVDAMDNATLVEVFRAEEDSCLLGTDAMRDGVDVPGRSLRLIVFDRIPWPRRTILHRARQARFGGANPRAIDDRIVRARLRQAFGRLIRAETDRGCFVLLDARAPSRLLSALPDGVVAHRVGLAQAVAEIRAFLARA
ncbi:MAG: ATP-dependent DNA helicase [Elioraea sp.]|nr:ATP-dependent DNA helicase [Elioraea sp.]